jgi:hypothetical protein
MPKEASACRKQRVASGGASGGNGRPKAARRNFPEIAVNRVRPQGFVNVPGGFSG